MTIQIKEQVSYKLILGLGGFLMAIIGGIMLLGFDKDAGTGIIIGVGLFTILGGYLSYKFIRN